jgi:hypothetical protein
MDVDQLEAELRADIDDAKASVRKSLLIQYMAEVSRLRQDLSTAIERAAKVAEDIAYGNAVWGATPGHVFDRTKTMIASSIRSLKTESSNG